jgi:hypothetical protein
MHLLLSLFCGRAANMHFVHLYPKFCGKTAAKMSIFENLYLCKGKGVLFVQKSRMYKSSSGTAATKIKKYLFDTIFNYSRVQDMQKRLV